ncbi:MAG TPA: S46 family peptidase, partial [Bacteroidales bacterium]|nr:S46 family peptidase [Bacteroidales bacterium]
RHTGDFSLFRIYANKENKPAAYSKDNVPYKPERFYTISLKGVNEGDFTMVYFYPCRTEEYLPSQAIRLQVDEVNPIRISLRDKRLDIMNRYAAINDTIRIQYAAKNAGVANGWKKWIGESKGINRMNGVSKKEAFEARFNDWSATASGMPYKEVLNGFESLYKPYNYWKRSEVYFQEAGLSAEIVRLALRFRGLVQMSQQKDSSDIAVKREAIKLKQSLYEFY